MIYGFGDFELDARAMELRAGGAAVPVEPQVFALLLLLVENRDRLVSKDEIIEKVWDGRIVSESALTSRVKSARQALGDDGKAQKYIRTVHGKGFRFVMETRLAGAPFQRETVQHEAAPGETVQREAALATAAQGETATGIAPPGEKPSIAVLPLRLVGVAGPHATIADALPHELISELSRLRWLFVIARGSSFRFRGSDPDLADVGRTLNVRYCLSGMVEIAGDRIAITVDLADTRDGGIIWGDRYEVRIDDVYEVRRQIVASIIAALEIQIPLHEAQRARLAAPENLDAWSAYHIGLQHLHRFNSKDNDIATGMFERAIALDPSFARAHAGLSSSRFQDVFVQYKDDLNEARKAARRHAERAVELDPLDPYSNFAMGRVYWVENDIASGSAWLDRAVRQSPNYAQGIYASAWSDTVTGHSEQARGGVDLALSLSPLDPFRYAMLGVRAFTYMSEGEMAEAAYWADDAARSPGAHVLIAMIAVAAHAANGDHEKASRWAENVRARNPNVTQKEFFTAFPFEHEAMRQHASKALAAYGF